MSLPIFCKVCGKNEHDSTYIKDHHTGESLYWADPTINKDTDIRIDFCGVECSVKWHLEKIAARNGEVGQSQS